MQIALIKNCSLENSGCVDKSQTRVRCVEIRLEQDSSPRGNHGFHGRVSFGRLSAPGLERCALQQGPGAGLDPGRGRAHPGEGEV